MGILSWLLGGSDSESQKEMDRQKKAKMGPERFNQEAQEAVEFWSDKELDYSPESLEVLDELIDETWDKERFNDAQFGGEDMKSLSLTGMVMQFGSYFGETLVRNLGGEWNKAPQNQSGISFQWIVNVQGNTVNVFHIAEDCFTEPSKFHHTYQILEKELDK